MLSCISCAVGLAAATAKLDAANESLSRRPADEADDDTADKLLRLFPGSWHETARNITVTDDGVLRAELPPILEADLSVSVSCPMPSDRESDDGDDIDTVLSASQLFERATFALLGCTGGRESRAG